MYQRIETVIPISIINESVNKLPEYKTSGASGFDIASNEHCYINPNGARLIKTGLFVAIPNGYEIQIRSRSGLAYNDCVFVLNSPGTIDSDYRGEIGIILFNASDNPFTVRIGDRIAQGVLSKVEKVSWCQVGVGELDETMRLAGGFGSTGV